MESVGYDDIPSAKICGNILKRNGLIDPDEATKRRAFKRFEREHCNELWQMDFKGDFELKDGSRCYPLGILDGHSRFCIQISAKSAVSGVRESVKKAFLEYGMPNAILTDNGAQFAGFRGGYTQFERWLMDLDILPIHSRFMHPQTQGKLECFHRTMKAEALHAQPNDLAHAQNITTKTTLFPETLLHL